jgi:hypothetical protein
MAAVARSFVLLLAFAAPAPPQDVTLRVVFAPEAEVPSPPALRWLRTDVLPRLPSWPAGLDASRAVRLDGPLRSPRVAAADIVLPARVCCAGELVCDETAVLFSSHQDGTEDWWITEPARLPAAAGVLLRRMRCEADGRPRSFDPSALIGNLLPAIADGDPLGRFLQAGAASCGPVDLRCWQEQGNWRVRGRSDGGLALPALLIWMAATAGGAADGRQPDAELDGWRLRAFAARDGDRAEAARQLLRAERAGAPALRALLHADQDSRIAAIDGLTSLGSVVDLPSIVAAADPSMPWVERLVADAVQRLWPQADAEVRTATRRSIVRSDSAFVRAIDPDASGGATAGVPGDAGRWRLLGALFVLGCCLHGLWWRERRHLRASARATATG